MKNVCVITGGGSGIGLAIAKNMPKEKEIVICGRTEAKLANAVSELKELGFDAHGITCDVSKREDVHELCLFAKSFGTLKNVVHAAGMSPSMADSETLIRVNAIGTKNVNMEFFKYMEPGSVIVDVASNSAYALPGIMEKHDIYKLVEYEEDKFIKKMADLSNMAPGTYQKAGLAYSLSKNFVVWYAQKCAFEYGPKGIRVCSVSPGLIDTDMGNLEKEQGKELIHYSAEERMGNADEVGFTIAMIADERSSYLAGTDVLIDGGSTNGKRFKKQKRRFQ